MFFCRGKRHDFRLFKQSNLRIANDIQLLLDTGLIGIDKLHKNSILPIKKRKNQKRTKEERSHNKEVASKRVTAEHGVGFIKRFKILPQRYRNRRKRFGLRFQLLAGVCNYDMGV